MQYWLCVAADLSSIVQCFYTKGVSQCCCSCCPHLLANHWKVVSSPLISHWLQWEFRVLHTSQDQPGGEQRCWIDAFHRCRRSCTISLSPSAAPYLAGGCNTNSALGSAAWRRSIAFVTRLEHARENHLQKKGAFPAALLQCRGLRRFLTELTTVV